MNAVASKKQYIERVQMALEHLHNCGAVHRATVPVHEVFRGQDGMEGLRGGFRPYGHPKAKRAYGWSHADGKDDLDEKFVAVLEMPPVDSPQTAVKVAIVAEIKKRKN